MKKTKFVVMLLALIMMISAFVLSSCKFDIDPQNPPSEVQSGGITRLALPVIVLENDTAYWTANPDAEKFEISIDGMLYYVENTVDSKKLEDGQKFKIRAIGDGKEYLTSEWSNEVEYQKITPTYTITWKFGDTILEVDEGVEGGSLPSYNGQEPQKDGYIFKGWTPNISEVMCDVTYEAEFEEIVVVLTYTVVFCDYDGTVLATYENLEKGASLTPPELPRRNGYTFIGWDNSFDNITSDLTVTAQYEASENQICIDYVDNGDGTLTAKFSVNGDVDIAMIELTFSFVLANATITDYTVFAKGSDANYVDDVFYFSLMSITDITVSTNLFSITFTKSTGNGYVKIVVEESYVSDGTFENITEANVVGTIYVY